MRFRRQPARQPQIYSDSHAREHDRSNQFQSWLIIFAMFALLCFAGFAIWGGLGVVMAAGVAAFTLFSVGRASPKMVLKMYKAKALGPRDLPDLQEMFDRLVERADLEHKPTLYYVPSKMLNAFATGRGSETVVAVTHGLLDKMNNREIGGVLAHELSHIKHKDVWVMSLADAFSRLTNSMGQIGQIMLLISLGALLFGKSLPIPMICVAILLFAPAASGLLQMALSRSREYEADYGAAQITGDPLALASALKKVDYAHTSWLKKLVMPGRKVPEASLLRTHPPTDDRVARLMAMKDLQELPTQMEVPRQMVNPPPQYVVLRRPKWHIMSGLWY